VYGRTFVLRQFASSSGADTGDGAIISEPHWSLTADGTRNSTLLARCLRGSSAKFSQANEELAGSAMLGRSVQLAADYVSSLGRSRRPVVISTVAYWSIIGAEDRGRFIRLILRSRCRVDSAVPRRPARRPHHRCQGSNSERQKRDSNVKALARDSGRDGYRTKSVKSAIVASYSRSIVVVAGCTPSHSHQRA
jgi:hypothetical protein